MKYSFYISSFNNLITHQTKNNDTVVSHYISHFGTIQLTSVTFAPIFGPYIGGHLMSCKSKQNSNDPLSKQEDTFKNLKRCAVAICITDFIGVILELTCLLPVLEAQYISMFSQVVLRGFLYALSFSYMAITMPARHYGKLLSTAFIIARIFSCIQYPLLSIVENQFNGDPFWIHVGLLIL